MARAAEGASDFWRTALAADSYLSAADAGRFDPEVTAIVARTQARASAAASRSGSSFRLFREQDRFASARIADALRTRLLHSSRLAAIITRTTDAVAAGAASFVAAPLFAQPTPALASPWFWPVMCCPAEFTYPESVRVDVKWVDDGVDIGVTFVATATFIPGKVCKCACCEFRQELEIQDANPGDGAEIPEQERREDTAVYAVDGERAFRYSPGHRDVDQTEHEDVGGGPDVTNEGTAQPRDSDLPMERPPDAPDGYYADPQHTIPNQTHGCYYRIVDTPSVHIPKGRGGGFAAVFIFNGEIWDVCWNQRLLYRSFTIRISGAVGFGSAHGEYRVHNSDLEGNPYDEHGHSVPAGSVGDDHASDIAGGTFSSHMPR